VREFAVLLIGFVVLALAGSLRDDGEQQASLCGTIFANAACLSAVETLKSE